MNAENFSVQQMLQLNRFINTQLYQLYNKISKDMLNFTEIEFFKIIIKYFITKREIDNKDIFKAFIDIYARKQINYKAINTIEDIIQCKSFLSRVMNYFDNLQVQDKYCHMLYLQWNKLKSSKALYNMASHLFINGYYDTIMQTQHANKVSNIQKFKKLYLYLPTFSRIQEGKRQQLIQQRRFNKNKIDELYNQYKYENSFNTQHQILKKIYQMYIQDSNNNQIKYSSYQLIEYITSLQPVKLKKEFNLKNYQDIDNILVFLALSQVQTLYELIMKVNIAKNLEYSMIEINFYQQFSVLDIPDNVIINMLNNIENRMLYIDASGYFIIIRRVSDNFIFKKQLDSSLNINKIDSLLQQYTDGMLYDVIIKSHDEYKSIFNIKMRYLNYMGNNIAISLKYPKDIVNLSLFQVQITNIDQCINLVNLCSQYNTYYADNLKKHCHIKRIYSMNDIYKNEGKCLIQDLFETNKIEYIHVYNDNPNSNIVGTMILSKNTENLVYMDVHQNKAQYNIILHPSKEQLNKLEVFQVITQNHDHQQYGSLYGTKQVVDQIKKQLINRLKDQS